MCWGFFKARKPFQGAIGAGLGLILPYLAEQATAGSLIAGSANTDFPPLRGTVTRPAVPSRGCLCLQPLASTGNGQAKTQRIRGANQLQSFPGYQPALFWVVFFFLCVCVCAAVGCGFVFFYETSFFDVHTGHKLREKVLVVQLRHFFFPASRGNGVWIHTQGKAIFIKEVPTLPLQTNHSWLVLQLQPYRKEGGEESIQHIISF